MPFPKIRAKDLSSARGELRMIVDHADEAQSTLRDLREGDPSLSWGEGKAGRLAAIKALMGDLYEIEQIAKRLRQEAIDLSIA
jgi:hypothetical protein